jgi:hypothetical protein
LPPIREERRDQRNRTAPAVGLLRQGEKGDLVAAAQPERVARGRVKVRRIGRRAWRLQACEAQGAAILQCYFEPFVDIGDRCAAGAGHRTGYLALSRCGCWICQDRHSGDERRKKKIEQAEHVVRVHFPPFTSNPRDPARHADTRI